jgi:hypothetical protein
MKKEKRGESLQRCLYLNYKKTMYAHVNNRIIFKKGKKTEKRKSES